MSASTITKFPDRKEKPQDLEIKDAHLIFNSVWDELVEERGRENLRFPREIFWLNGAPGAGKGTQTRFIMQLRYLTAPPVVISDLLDTPEARRLKDAGMMVGDREVTGLFLRKLLDPVYESGVVVDGYPRTKVQVECLKLLHQRLNEQRAFFRDTELAEVMPKPVFHIIVLYVDETESVRRQLYRGQQARLQNQEAEARDEGETVEIRKTDLDEEAARSRYRTFKEVTFESLKSLRQVFHYHFINAQGSIEEVQRRIVSELKYQSSLELEDRTYDRISDIPIATTISTHARQELVKRLDNYDRDHPKLFQQVTVLIQDKFIPIIRRHAISGMAFINSEDEVWTQPVALAMFIDIFSERGFHAVVDIRKEEVPDAVDLSTGKITTRTKRVYRFRISFPPSEIRRGS